MAAYFQFSTVIHLLSGRSFYSDMVNASRLRQQACAQAQANEDKRAENLSGIHERPLLTVSMPNNAAAAQSECKSTALVINEPGQSAASKRSRSLAEVGSVGSASGADFIDVEDEGENVALKKSRTDGGQSHKAAAVAKETLDKIATQPDIRSIVSRNVEKSSSQPNNRAPWLLPSFKKPCTEIESMLLANAISRVPQLRNLTLDGPGEVDLAIRKGIASRSVMMDRLGPQSGLLQHPQDLAGQIGMLTTFANTVGQ